MTLFRTMAERLLRHFLLDHPRNVGPVNTTIPVPLVILQCCTHRPGLKRVQANACLCQAANFPYTSSFPSEIFATGTLRGPLLHQGSWPTWAKTLRRPKKPPQSYVRTSPDRLSIRRTGVLTQYPHKRSQLDWLTGLSRQCPRGTSAHQDRRPQHRHTGGRRERQNKFKLCTTNWGSNRVPQSAYRPW